jgi:hypothetical protein
MRTGPHDIVVSRSCVHTFSALITAQLSLELGKRESLITLSDKNGKRLKLFKIFKIIATNNPSLKTSPALRSAVIEVSARMT